MTQSELVSLFNERLKLLGYRKKDRSWYKENPETITILALEKSRWGEVYYVSLCVSFTKLNQDKRPKFYRAHGRIRVGNLNENTEEELNLEENIDEDHRKQLINQLLNRSLIILERMETEAGFKELLKQYNPRLFMLGKQTQEYLGIKVD